VIVYSGSSDTTSIDWLVSRRLPVVMVDRPRRAGISSVGVENTDGAGEAAEHVLALGHRRVAVLTSWVDAPEGAPASTVRAVDGHHRERLEGWTQVLAAEGVAPPVFGLDHEMTRAECADVARTMLSAPDRPTAVLCFSDLLAAGVLDAARDLGLAVPRDLTVVGFDDAPLATATSPAMTTVRQDLSAKGSAAVDLLFAAMDADREGRKHRPRHLRVPTGLVVRDSSGPAPATAR
jgi:DNA-binding LacI/PurR family transcriptional regulator